MCTVTFLPTADGVVLTSNRDEQQKRQRALPPEIHPTKRGSILFPKDPDKGGTWIAATATGDAAVLLNGAFRPHTPDRRYTRSRGAVIPMLLAEPGAAAAFQQNNWDDTEPFTLILYQDKRLFECRWDGQWKTVTELDGSRSWIWSSATLYPKETMRRREQWFQKWQSEQATLDWHAVLRFHEEAGDGDRGNDLVMNRNGELLTVSITSVLLGNDDTRMRHRDLLAQQQFLQVLPRDGRRNGNSVAEWIGRFRIRLRHWEYWPFTVVYFPIFFYWFFLCLKARSFFFFNTANPTIRNGGFLMESKKEIYDLLPRGTYPATVLVQPGSANAEDVVQETRRSGISFPLIVKPDIGLRGMGVQKLFSETELVRYHRSACVDYLVQALIPYQREIGVFYYRYPGAASGVVTGLVEKELLTLRGNGRETITQLLQQEPRYRLQLPQLRRKLGPQLSEVLAPGEERVLVPFGNHSRGAKFIDVSDRIDPELTASIDRICREVPGFYFGRLDIRYESWEQLRAGRRFAIVELNGAGSEPAHIYDPRHSLLFAWKEICRHLRILFEISRRNKAMQRLPYLTTREGLRLLRDNARYVKKIG
ncbi:NRDE family protein [Flaviaesturariibacter amylovorans]|uniref:ATP-grasp domain-containing protein n=1 Tax=Flaviaesturariibacter amylovorans TaxID=1084520 RepID=A0ABP8H6W9_9BACT